MKDLENEIRKARETGAAEWLQRLLAIREAVYKGDSDSVYELAGCGCCCSDHTFSDCVGRLVGICRSGLPYGVSEHQDLTLWAKHYGMSLDKFLGLE